MRGFDNYCTESNTNADITTLRIRTPNADEVISAAILVWIDRSLPYRCTIIHPLRDMSILLSQPEKACIHRQNGNSFSHKGLNAYDHVEFKLKTEDEAWRIYFSDRD